MLNVYFYTSTQGHHYCIKCYKSWVHAMLDRCFQHPYDASYSRDTTTTTSQVEASGCKLQDTIIEGSPKLNLTAEAPRAYDALNSALDSPVLIACHNSIRELVMH